MNFTSKNPIKKAGLDFLSLTNPRGVEIARKAMIDIGFRAERKASDALKHLAQPHMKRPPNTTGKPKIREQIITLVNRRLPEPRMHKTLRSLLKLTDPTTVPIIRKKNAATPRPSFTSRAAATNGFSLRWEPPFSPCFMPPVSRR